MKSTCNLSLEKYYLDLCNYSSIYFSVYFFDPKWGQNHFLGYEPMKISSHRFYLSVYHEQ